MENLSNINYKTVHYENIPTNVLHPGTYHMQVWEAYNRYHYAKNVDVLSLATLTSYSTLFFMVFLAIFAMLSVFAIGLHYTALHSPLPTCTIPSPSSSSTIEISVSTETSVVFRYKLLSEEHEDMLMEVQDHYPRKITPVSFVTSG